MTGVVCLLPGSRKDCCRSPEGPIKDWWLFHAGSRKRLVLPYVLSQTPENGWRLKSCPRPQKRTSALCPVTGPKKDWCFAVCPVPDSIKCRCLKSCPKPQKRTGATYTLLNVVQCVPRSKRRASGVCSVPEPTPSTRIALCCS
jgi:hypothetical protein